ncbi:MAG TPA: HesA/MoeB/ThiF family protein [Rickettsiales bacterium]|nr:HesA/MoeB/ThiF family protein [Rickettsiales bacterium]
MLTDNQLRRYARNISLPGVGKEGQEKLLAAQVLVIGAGGLGAPVLAYLASSGVGHIGIVEDDRVELSNLQRQILFETGDIGRFKAEAARDRISELNPEIRITLHRQRLDNANAAALMREYDIVVDTSDNFATRFAVNAACLAEKKTLVSGAVRAFEGQLAVFKPYLGENQPCYRCFVGGAPDDERGCRDLGVLGALTGIVGSMQALETLRELLGIGESSAGKLLRFDALTMQWKSSILLQDPDCECCGSRPLKGL